jgi:hypothetical protein
VREGATDHSYGLSCVPAPVVERSRDVLDRLRGEPDIEDTSPVDLLGRVQEWQRRLEK